MFYSDSIGIVFPHSLQSINELTLDRVNVDSALNDYLAMNSEGISYIAGFRACPLPNEQSL